MMLDCVLVLASALLAITFDGLALRTMVAGRESSRVLSCVSVACGAVALSAFVGMATFSA
jgi:hypothetical protein